MSFKSLPAYFFKKKIKHFEYTHDGDSYLIYPTNEIGRKTFDEPIKLKYSRTDERDGIIRSITNLITELVISKDDYKSIT